MFWKLQENILEKEHIEELVDFIKNTKRFTQFKKVKEFEEAWSQWQGCRYSVFVNSGSSANFLIMSIMKQLKGWQQGDEVIVPVVTWPTNISPVFQCGLKPVFVDVNLDDFSFDYNQLETKINERTRAIFVTHLLGFPADIEKIKEVIDGRDIEILEDCCESHGAKIKDGKVGNFGRVSSFSFYWGHHMTTVEGGMVCTNDEEIYKQAVLKRSHGLVRELPPRYHNEYKERYSEINFEFLFLTDGFNFRNTEFNAVLGLSQLKSLDRYIAIRNENYRKFIELLKFHQEYFFIPHKEGASSFSLPFLFKDTVKKKAFQKKLAEAEIESRPIVGGNLMRQPFLTAYNNPAHSHWHFPNAEFVHQNGFYIGNNQFVDGGRLERLKEIMDDFFNKYKTNSFYDRDGNAVSERKVV